MKFLHIILPTKRMMGTYIEMIREYYPVDNHTFYIIGNIAKTEEVLFEYKNVIKLDKGKNIFEKIRNLYNDFNKYDVLIWHGLVITPKITLFLFFYRKFIKKSVWVMWGIDLYSWKRNQKEIKAYFINYLNKYIRKNINNVVAIFPTDIKNYRNIFQNKKSTVFYAPYPISKNGFLELENKNSDRKRTSGEIWIQVGNNANSFNNHLEILEELKKFKNEKIRLFIPMSYGNDWHNKIDNYKEIVERTAIEYFGEEKVTILRNLMPNDEYNKFLDQIDIIIIATNRQNALGNILKVLYSGGKAFLSEKNSLYDFFSKENIFIEKFETIKDLTFEEFKLPTSNNALKFWMKKNYYPSNNVLFWNNIFKSFDINNRFYKTLEDAAENNDTNINEFLSNKVHVKEKKNFLNLKQYTSKNQNEARAIKNMKSLVIVGTDISTIKILSLLFNSNKQVYRFHIIGIIDEKLHDIGNIAHGYNMIGSIKNYNIAVNDRFVVFCDDPKNRHNYYINLKTKGAIFASIKLNNVTIGSNFTYEEAYYIGNNSIIGFNCSFGKLVKIGNNTIVGSNCIFGDFSTIGDNCIIPDNTIIKEYTEIESGVIWR